MTMPFHELPIRRFSLLGSESTPDYSDVQILPGHPERWHPVLLHAGIADRRMWDPIWSALAVERDVVRLDLRGIGQSVSRPRGMLSPVDDVLDTLAAVDIDRSHLVGASFGAEVAVEVALTRPQQVVSMLLSPPGGSLIAEVTPDLRAFIETENAALARGDLGAPVEANLTWCVVCCSATGRAAGRRRPLAPTPTLRRLPAGP